MPELRQDVVTGNWTVVATERAMRPSDLSEVKPVEISGPEDCPFCPGNERMTPPELYALRPDGTPCDGPGWRMRVIPNKFPAFKHCEVVADSNVLFSRNPAEGTHEVIIHSPAHELRLADMPDEDVALLIELYRERYLINAADCDVNYVHIILNYGAEAGASLEHPHTQLFGIPLLPPYQKLELEGSSGYMDRTGSCVFCDLIAGEIEGEQRVVALNDKFVAITPFASRFPFEIWIIPRLHQPSFGLISDAQIKSFAEMLRDILGKLDRKFANPPLNYYIHSAPCDGQEYGCYHWHLECFPRVATPGGFEWGTEMMINVVTPEHAAEFLRS